MLPLYIDWQPSLTLFEIGPLAIRWYSMCWCLGLLAAYLIVQRLYRLQSIPAEKFEPLFMYCFIGVLVGARLGHCLFYEPGYYLSSPMGMLEMFLPARHTAEGWQFTGYEGLASHGGVIGLATGILLYCRRMKVNSWTVLDNVGIAAPLTSAFIRMGNLMNSEIIGNPTDMPWGFVFHTREALVDGILAPRHPAQLYEAIAYLVIFFIQVWLYRTRKGTVGTSFFFGTCLASIFLFRFFVEFLKKEQVAFEQGMMLDMGQILSIPIVLVALYCVWKGIRVHKESRIQTK